MTIENKHSDRLQEDAYSAELRRKSKSEIVEDAIKSLGEDLKRVTKKEARAAQTDPLPDICTTCKCE